MHVFQGFCADSRHLQRSWCIELKFVHANGSIEKYVPTGLDILDARRMTAKSDIVVRRASKLSDDAKVEGSVKHAHGVVRLYLQATSQELGNCDSLESAHKVGLW